jgi:hypothetical protein
MKKIFAAATAIAALATATPALADGDNTSTDTTTITVNANNPAKCNVTSSALTVALADNQISNNDGFAVSDLGSKVAAALDGLTVSAWCTGGNNTVNLQRTALVRNGSNGAKTSEGFNQSIIYDIAMDVADANRVDGTKPIEGTSDGAVGPTNVGRFGPNGVGSEVTFSNEAGSSSNASSVGTSGGSGPRSGFTADAARLAAGAYTGTVTIVVTPGA